MIRTTPAGDVLMKETGRWECHPYPPHPPGEITRLAPHVYIPTRAPALPRLTVECVPMHARITERGCALNRELARSIKARIDAGDAQAIVQYRQPAWSRFFACARCPRCVEVWPDDAERGKEVVREAWLDIERGENWYARDDEWRRVNVLRPRYRRRWEAWKAKHGNARGKDKQSQSNDEGGTES